MYSICSKIFSNIYASKRFARPSQCLRKPAMFLKQQKNVFLIMGEKWLNPTTAALGALHGNIDLSKIFTTKTPGTRALLWSNRPLSAFFYATSASSPCLTTGSRDDWEAFMNNISCERLIGRVKETINDKKNVTQMMLISRLKATSIMHIIDEHILLLKCRKARSC